MRNWKRSVIIIFLLVSVSGCLDDDEIHPDPLAIIEIEGDDRYSNETILFNASRSIGYESPIVDYEWSIKNTDLGINETRYGIVISHQFISPGTFDIELTVIDNDGGKDSDFIQINIVERVVEFQLHLNDNYDAKYLNWVDIKDSVIISIKHNHWTISVLEGRGGYPTSDGSYKDESNLNLSGENITISMEFVDLLLVNTQFTKNQINTGDHFTISWKAVVLFDRLFTYYSRIWNDEGLTYACSIWLDPLKIDDSHTLEISRRDDLIDEMGLNDTDLVRHPISPYFSRNGYPYGIDILWSPLNDTILYMNTTVAEELGFNVINISLQELDPPYGENSPFHYDSYLDLETNDKTVSLVEKENRTVSINDKTYLITVTNLLKLPEIVKFNYSIDAPLGFYQRFFIERIDI